jgi:hypothetical protein
MIYRLSLFLPVSLLPFFQKSSLISACKTQWSPHSGFPVQDRRRAEPNFRLPRRSVHRRRFRSGHRTRRHRRTVDFRHRHFRRRCRHPVHHRRRAFEGRPGVNVIKLFSPSTTKRPNKLERLSFTRLSSLANTSW